MAKISNKLWKIWGATSNKVGAILEYTDRANFTSSKDLDIIQNTFYESGFAGISPDLKVTIQNCETALYSLSKKLAFIQQEGIIPYIATKEYYATGTIDSPSIVKEPGTTKIYASKTDNNIGNALTDSNNWLFLGDLANLINSGVSADTIRFAVNSSKVDVNGYADFIQKDIEDQTTILANATDKLIFTSYNGITKTIVANIIKTGLSGLADAVYNIIYDFSTDTVEFELQSKFTESFNIPSGGVDGDYWIRTNPLETYKRISGVWTLHEFANLGENTRTGGVWSSSPVSYALNGLYSNIQEILTNGTLYPFSANIGTKNINIETYIECKVSSNNFNIGDRLYFKGDGNSGTASAFYGWFPSIDSNALTVNMTVGASGVGSLNKTLGNVQSGMIISSWRGGLIVKRSY